MINFTGVFLTVENHGCVYTICTEGELFYAPMYENGNVNFNEFDVFYFEAINEPNWIQSLQISGDKLPPLQQLPQ